jgi:hypothetical protein
VVEYEAQTEKNKPALARNLNLDCTQIKRILDKWENFGSVEIDLREDNPGRPNLFDQDKIEEIKVLIANFPDKRVRS